MQVDLKVRFSFRVSLVDRIALLAPGGRNRTLSFDARDRHVAPSF